MALTAKEVTEKLYENDFTDPKDYGYRDPIDYMHGEETDLEIDGLPTLKFVDAYGGEGQGDEKYVVFSIGDQLFRMSGFYSSWGDDEWDGELEEVQAKQVQRTEYEAI